MKSDQILQALSKLDPSNKDQWTANGQPLLSAIGEGVSRQQVLDVAPLFSRDNPVLPQQDTISDEEVQKTLEEELMEIDAAREASQAALVAAHKAKKDAEQAVRDAEAKLEALRERERNRDKRTDAEINQDYLKSEFQQRLARAGAQAQARALLDQAGLGNHVKSLTASPIDRAIAERIIRERKQRPHG